MIVFLTECSLALYDSSRRGCISAKEEIVRHDPRRSATQTGIPNRVTVLSKLQQPVDEKRSIRVGGHYAYRSCQNVHDGRRGGTRRSDPHREHDPTRNTVSWIWGTLPSYQTAEMALGHREFRSS